MKIQKTYRTEVCVFVPDEGNVVDEMRRDCGLVIAHRGARNHERRVSWKMKSSGKFAAEE